MKRVERNRIPMVGEETRGIVHQVRQPVRSIAYMTRSRGLNTIVSFDGSYIGHTGAYHPCTDSIH